jgi:hypothetical protein
MWNRRVVWKENSLSSFLRGFVITIRQEINLLLISWNFIDQNRFLPVDQENSNFNYCWPESSVSIIKNPKLPYSTKKEPRAETRGLFNQLWLVIGWSRYNSRIFPGKSQEISHFHFKGQAGFYRKIVSFKINRTLRNWKRPILLSLSSILSLPCCRSMIPTGITGSRSTCMFVFYTGWICPVSGAGTLSTWEWSYTWLVFFCISRTF